MSAVQGPDSPEGYAGAVPGFGGRRQYSFNSATYQSYALRLQKKKKKKKKKKKSLSPQSLPFPLP